MTTRKKYPKEFMLDVVSLVLEQEYTKAEKITVPKSLVFLITLECCLSPQALLRYLTNRLGVFIVYDTHTKHIYDL